ncbi:MAG: NUDIX hydrolase [Planctomycetes bacterium]|nr:NUDIX hydrolase [Planctomycetota bacterium]
MASARFTSARTIFASPRFALMEETFATSDGAVVRPVIHHPGAVAILAQPTPDTLLLVRQYRYPIRRWTLEIPAGTRVPGEAPEATAARELQEEAGFSAAHLEELTRFLPAVGVSDEELIIYRATGLSEIAAAPEHGELVAREVVALGRVPALLAEGLICDAKTLFALVLIGLPVSFAKAAAHD